MEDGAGQKVRCFQCTDMPLTGCDDLIESVEQCGIEVPPSLRLLEVANVATIGVVGLVGVKPSCHAEAVSW